MNKKLTGVQSIGIKLPIIREGDDLVNIVVKSVLTAIRDYDKYYDRYIYNIDDNNRVFTSTRNYQSKLNPDMRIGLHAGFWKDLYTSTYYGK